jgi:hypothetical protein
MKKSNLEMLEDLRKLEVGQEDTLKFKMLTELSGLKPYVGWNPLENLVHAFEVLDSLDTSPEVRLNPHLDGYSCSLLVNGGICCISSTGATRAEALSNSIIRWKGNSND